MENFPGGFSPSVPLCSSSSPMSWRSRVILSSVRDCRAQGSNALVLLPNIVPHGEKIPFSTPWNCIVHHPQLWLTGKSHSEHPSLPLAPHSMKSAQAPSAPPSSGAGPIPALALGVSSASRAQPAPKHPCGCAEWMKIPWIPHSSCLPRAICSLAKECPTSQTWLQQSRARTGSCRVTTPHFFLAFPACRASAGSFTFPRSLPTPQVQGGIPWHSKFLSPDIPAKGGIRELPLLMELPGHWEPETFPS